MNSQQLISKKNIAIVLILGIAALVILANIAGRQAQKASLAEKPKECVPLYGKGKQTYNVLTEKPARLQIMQLDVDPIDVEKGAAQTITATVKDEGNNTITDKSGVSAKIFLDSKNFTVALKLVNAQDLQEQSGKSLVTTWQGMWTKEDSTCYTYRQTITAKNDKGEETSVAVTFK